MAPWWSEVAGLKLQLCYLEEKIEYAHYDRLVMNGPSLSGVTTLFQFYLNRGFGGRRGGGEEIEAVCRDESVCERTASSSSFKKRTLEYLDWKLAMAPKNEWWMRILPCRLPMIEWEPQKCTLNSNNHTLMEYPMRKALEWNHWEWRAETSFLYFHIMGMSIYAQILLMWMWDGVRMENELRIIAVV